MPAWPLSRARSAGVRPLPFFFGIRVGLLKTDQQGAPPSSLTPPRKKSDPAGRWVCARGFDPIDVSAAERAFINILVSGKAPSRGARRTASAGPASTRRYSATARFPRSAAYTYTSELITLDDERQSSSFLLSTRPRQAPSDQRARRVNHTIGCAKKAILLR